MDIEVKENFEIKNLTSFKVGGCAERAYFPKSQSELVYLLSNLECPLVLGNCSNVLVSTNGIKGDVIFTGKMSEFEIRGTKVVADCGVKGPMLAKNTIENGLSGFEFMIGFPGSVGGNVYMNASAHGQAISNHLVSVCVFDIETKELKIISKRDLEFAYRTSVLQKKPYIVLSAEFNLEKGNIEEIRTIAERNLEFRKQHQPSMALPNCGSVFKNPENDSAGRLLDRADAKTLVCGGAKVWDNHANFIINFNNATSENILNLMLMMYNSVKERYTINLIPEVKFIGEMTENEEKIWKILYAK